MTWTLKNGFKLFEKTIVALEFNLLTLNLNNK